MPTLHVFAPGRGHLQRGFSLIELIIAVAIVAILARIALPAYFDTIRKGRRSEAVAAMSMVQQAQERYRANNSLYGDALGYYTSGGSFYGVAASTASISGVTLGTFNTANGYYQLSVSGVTGTTYNILAQAQGSQANDSTCKYMQMAVSGGNTTYTSGSTSSLGNGAFANGQCWKK